MPRYSTEFYNLQGPDHRDQLIKEAHEQMEGLLAADAQVPYCGFCRDWRQAYLLWLDGKSKYEIANIMGISTNRAQEMVVWYQHWLLSTSYWFHALTDDSRKGLFRTSVGKTLKNEDDLRAALLDWRIAPTGAGIANRVTRACYRNLCALTGLSFHEMLTECDRRKAASKRQAANTAATRKALAKLMESTAGRGSPGILR